MNALCKLACALCVALPSTALATDVAIVGGTILRVSGARINAGTIVIRDEKIVSVGPDVAIPAGAEIIDAKGKIVTPGLIDAATDLGAAEIWAIPDAEDVNLKSRSPIRAALDMRDAIDPRSTAIGVARRHGVTAAGVLPMGGVISGKAAFFELAEARPDAPDPVVAAMVVSLGEGGAASSGGTRALAALKLREAFTDARLYRRDLAAFSRNQVRRLSASRADLEALAEVTDGRLPLLVYASRASDIRAALRLARTEKLKIAIIGAEEGWLVADELAKQNVPVVVSPLENLPQSFESRYARADNAALMATAGVKVSITTGSTHNSNGLRFFAGNAIRAGLPAEVALRGITLGPAEILRADKTQGSIDPGKLATVVVWSGDPFEPSSFAEMVFIRGVRQPVDSRQTALFRKYRAKLGL